MTHEECHIFGWGSTRRLFPGSSPTDQKSEMLINAPVEIISHTTCSRWYNKIGKLCKAPQNVKFREIIFKY